MTDADKSGVATVRCECGSADDYPVGRSGMPCTAECGRTVSTQSGVGSPKSLRDWIAFAREGRYTVLAIPVRELERLLDEQDRMVENARAASLD